VKVRIHPGGMSAWGGSSPGRGGGMCPAFTLIELMLVIGILALVMAMGVPAIYSSIKRGPMRQAITGVTEACDMAKARAVLGGHKVKIILHPRERSYSVEGGPEKGLSPRATGAGTIDESITIEMLDVNLSERRETCTKSTARRITFAPSITPANRCSWTRRYCNWKFLTTGSSSFSSTPAPRRSTCCTGAATGILA